MMDELKIDARKWRFLDDPVQYLARQTGGLQIEPLTRQFKTAKEILSRLARGSGVLLADDVGLGKTTVSVLVAWVVACQGMRVRIYAPNEVLRRRWAEELERHIPMLEKLGATSDQIKQGDVSKLKAGRIQVATHHALVTSHRYGEQRTACDLMVIDEAHRAKGDGSAFNEALHNLGELAKRKLILTATPFSIRLTELEQLLQFVGAKQLEAVRHYAADLKRLYAIGDGHDITAECKRLVSAAKAAIKSLQPYVIRHCIEDLPAAERRRFGSDNTGQWEIPTRTATQQDLCLLLRVDRLLQLTPNRKGERRNDPRFHVGWQHLSAEIDLTAKRAMAVNADNVVLWHIKKAKTFLNSRRVKLHPKIAAVSEAIRPLVDAGEKVLIFCHHRATASELLIALERGLKIKTMSRRSPPEKVWQSAWKSLLSGEDPLMTPIINWLCTRGVRRQVSHWLGEPADCAKDLARQLANIRPRSVSSKVATVSEAATALTTTLLDTQSTSTRALLKAIAKGQQAFGGQVSHFPGRMDEGLRVMGAWDHDGIADRPQTLYTGKPDIVLAVFNSPFGPDVLVATDRLSEGVDLHRCCRHLIHYELDPSPVRTLQRNGRVRRVGSWAATTNQPIRYAYPTFGGTRDDKAVEVMKQRVNAFGLLLGGVPSLDDNIDGDKSIVAEVLGRARIELERLNRKLCV